MWRITRVHTPVFRPFRCLSQFLLSRYLHQQQSMNIKILINSITILLSAFSILLRQFYTCSFPVSPSPIKLRHLLMDASRCVSDVSHSRRHPPMSTVTSPSLLMSPMTTCTSLPPVNHWWYTLAVVTLFANRVVTIYRPILDWFTVQ